MWSAIILAGGKGNRFQNAPQEDKLLVKVGGEIVIRRVAKVLADLADDLILAVDERSRGERYEKILKDIGSFRVVIDIDPAFNAPLIGFISGIMESRGRYSLVVPGDAAYIGKEELKSIMQRVESGGFDCCVPCYNGYVQTLFQALLTEKAREIAKLLLQYNWKKPDGFIRGSSRTICLSFSPYTSGFSPFKTINTLEDILDSKKARISLENEVLLEFLDCINLLVKPINSNDALLRLYEVLIRNGNFFWAGVITSTLKGFGKISAKAFLRERDFLRDKGLISLALHAERDAYRLLDRG